MRDRSEAEAPRAEQSRAACAPKSHAGRMSAEHAPARRNTRQRQLVIDAVRARCDHPTAEDIYQDVRAIDGKVSRGTVYRNLNLLTETGAITTVKAPGTTRFDWRCDGHGHAVCRRCGAVADIRLPYDAELDERASAESGFSVGSHSLVFEGICPACRED